jgi:hypothetical protein
MTDGLLFCDRPPQVTVSAGIMDRTAAALSKE